MQPPAEAMTTKKKILIIDDESLLRATFCDFFEDFGFDVFTAKDGRDGLAQYQEEHPDAILVDLNMPRLDGFKVIETVHQDAPNLPIIVMSGVGLVDEAVRAIRLGAWDFISKPISDLELLMHTLDRAFERAQLIAENNAYKRSLEEKVRLRSAQLAMVNESLHRTQSQIVKQLARVGEHRDNQTSKHIIRVANYTEVIARSLGLSQQKIELIKQTAPLHDIGKIGVPDYILLKPTGLSASELKTIQKHCEIGFDILSPAPDPIGTVRERMAYALKINADHLSAMELLNQASIIALFHHEKWDGSGYPSGIKGETIPIEARITTIADIYDAAGSKRPYKEGLPEKDCQKILGDLSGTHLDPEVVNAFFDSREEILEIKQQWQD